MSFLKSKIYLYICLIWGVLALVALSSSGGTIFVLSIISIIGIPFAILLAIAPTIFIVLATIGVSGHILQSINRYMVFLAFPIAVALLIIPPYLGNEELEKQALALVEHDKKDYVAKERISSLALIQPQSSALRCPDLCQRALLTGAVEAVILTRAKMNQQALIPSQKAKKYRLEKRGNCPQTSFKRTGGVFRVPGETWRYGDARASEILDFNIANGMCLIEEDATVGEADTVIFINQIDRRARGAINSFDINADTVSAMRLISYKKNKNGHHEIIYQSTGVNLLKLMPLYAPTFVHTHGLKFAEGLWRKEESRGDYRGLKSQSFLATFLTKNLGLKLKLSEIATSNNQKIAKEFDVSKFIDEQLNQAAELTGATQRVITDFFISLHRKKTINKEETLLALKIIQDERVPIPRHAAAPIRKLNPDDSDLSGRFASALFKKLFKISPNQREADPEYLGYPMRYLGTAIEALPDHAVIPYKEQLRLLARSNERRVQAYRAFRKFGAFDKGVIPDLIYLLDSADEEFRKSGKRKASWQHPYLGAFYGLCELGEKGKEAIPLLYERINNGKIVKFGSYWKLTIRALVSLGADADEAYEYLKSDKRNHSRKHFDHVVRSTKRNTKLQRTNSCSW